MECCFVSPRDYLKNADSLSLYKLYLSSLTTFEAHVIHKYRSLSRLTDTISKSTIQTEARTVRGRKVLLSIPSRLWNNILSHLRSETL